MAYRYIFTPACIRDVEDLAQRRQHRLIVAMLVAHIPTILPDPQGAGEPKRGALRGCYSFTLMRGAGAAYRLVYTIRNDVVVFIAVGEHDAAYRDAERRV